MSGNRPGGPFHAYQESNHEQGFVTPCRAYTRGMTPSGSLRRSFPSSFFALPARLPTGVTTSPVAIWAATSVPGIPREYYLPSNPEFGAARRSSDVGSVGDKPRRRMQKTAVVHRAPRLRPRRVGRQRRATRRPHLRSAPRDLSRSAGRYAARPACSSTLCSPLRV